MVDNLHRSKWTPAAIECYKKGCNCSICEIKNYIKSQSCQMKYVVIELVRVYGAPNKMAQNEP